MPDNLSEYEVQTLPAGPERIVHVIARVLAKNIAKDENEPIVGVRLKANPEYVLTARHAQIMGPSDLFHTPEQPLPGTNGRGVCYVVTKAAIKVYYDKLRRHEGCHQGLLRQAEGAALAAANGGQEGGTQAMSPHAFVLRRPDGSLSAVSHTASEGLKLLGYTIEWFEPGTVPIITEAGRELVVGSIEAVSAALRRWDGWVPTPINYPPALKSFFGRDIRRSTLGAVRRTIHREEQGGYRGPDEFGNPDQRTSLFVKPLQEKTFDGRVITQFRDLIPTAHLPEDTEVWTSTLVRFLSEHRVFVQKGEVIGVRHYKGDPLVFPSPAVIREMLQRLNHPTCPMPAAYTLDVGVSSKGETLLVEVNDAHSAGPYGLDPLLYARFIETRWCQLTNMEPAP